MIAVYIIDWPEFTALMVHTRVVIFFFLCLEPRLLIDTSVIPASAACGWRVGGWVGGVDAPALL